jgi:hypothetical protein
LESELLDAVVLAALGLLEDLFDPSVPQHAKLAKQWKDDIRHRGYDPDISELCHKWVRQANPEDPRLEYFTDLYTCFMMAAHRYNNPVSYDGSDTAHFFRAYQACGENHRFFVTDDGRIGLGQRHAEIGDVVVVFDGASVPFLLRPVENGYVLVGSCYCYSLMHGEYAKRLESLGKLDEEIVTFMLV